MLIIVTVCWFDRRFEFLELLLCYSRSIRNINYIATTLYLCATGEVKLGDVSTQAAVCQVLGGEVPRRNWAGERRKEGDGLHHIEEN